MIDLTNRRLYQLTALALGGMAIAAVFDFIYAPQDALQGPVQRIFYLHVASAVSAYVCFGLVLAGGVLYLTKESVVADRLARSAAVVGLLFTINCLVMGIIWAKPIWNWDPTHTWDARFTSTVVLGSIYAGYLLVRRFSDEDRSAMRVAAVVGIIGFIDVPIVHFSVDWWRTLHPGPVIEEDALPGSMLLAFVVTLLFTLFLTAVMVLIRYRLEEVYDEREIEAVPGLELADQR